MAGAAQVLMFDPIQKLREADESSRSFPSGQGELRNIFKRDTVEMTPYELAKAFEARGGRVYIEKP